jgi:hypothetical protein
MSKRNGYMMDAQKGRQHLGDLHADRKTVLKWVSERKSVQIVEDSIQ